MKSHRLQSFRGAIAALAGLSALFFTALVLAPLVSASHAGGADAFSIDMDPANAPANTATTLGSREDCAQVNENDLLDADEGVNADELQVDVTATNIPPETAMIAFTFAMSYPAPNLTVTARDSAYLLNSNSGSTLLDLGDAMPDSDGRYYGAVADLDPGVPESGSGVLQRVTIATTSGAATGEYALLLSEAYHVDLLNVPNAPDALNHASVAVNQACGVGPIETPSPTATPGPTPTPTPPVPGTPTPTPGPGSAAIGVDHNGGAPDINPGPAVANPNATVSVVAEAPPEGIGAWTVDVHYDPAVLSVVACVPNSGSVCNPAFSVVEVRFTGATATGLFGAVDLADITFAAVGSPGSCSSLDLEVVTFTDPEGTDLAVAVAGGGICVGGGPCEPAPANDEIANATPVGPLPFVDAIDTACGTTAFDDPFCAGQGPTVWYEYTPAENGSIEANTFGSNYDTTLSVYVGAPGSLLQIACNDDSGSLQSKVIVPVSAGEAYFFMVGSFFGGPGGSLEFTVQENIPLAIDVTIDARGSVVPKEGVATVRGTYSCTKPAEVQVFGELRQRAGRAIITGWFSADVACDGYGAWEVEAVSSNGRFAGGTAEVQLSAAGFTFDEVAFDEATGDVRLTGTKPPRSARCPRDGNLGFESGVPDSSGIPCWTVASLGPGGWCTQAGALPPAGDCAGSGFPVAAPPEGAQAAMVNQGGPGGHVLYQCGVLRAGAISLQLYILNVAGVFFSQPTLDPFGPFANQQVRVDLVSAAAMTAYPFTTAAGDVLMNIYQSQPGDPVESGYSTVEADAGAYVGQEVCLRIAEVANIFFLNAGVDDVRISLRRSH